MGWFKQEGIEVELVPLPGLDRLREERGHQGSALWRCRASSRSRSCRPQGIKAKFFYTAYQGNIYGIAVPADSPIKKFADLKGKTIGVTIDGLGRRDRRAAQVAAARAQPGPRHHDRGGRRGRPARGA